MTVWLNKHPEQAPLFRTDENNATQAGNRCKLYPRHVLLMVLQHYKNDLTQEGMTTIWRIGQSTISRYLKLAKSILKDIMPTADNLYQDIINATTVDELLKIIKYGKPQLLLPQYNTSDNHIACNNAVYDTVMTPTAQTRYPCRFYYSHDTQGMVDNVITNAESTESKEVQLYNKFKEVMGISPAFGMYNKEKEYRLYKEIVEDLGRILIMDGTHVSTYRPEESMERRFRYSGKKKSFTFNTNLMITGYGLIIFKSKTVNGSTHDMTLLKEDMPDFDKLCSLLGHKTVLPTNAGDVHRS